MATAVVDQLMVQGKKLGTTGPRGDLFYGDADDVVVLFSVFRSNDHDKLVIHPDLEGLNTLQINATMADANVGYDYTNPWQGQFVLNGLSDSANLIAFYDKEQLQVRVAYNWRDDFLAGVGQGQGTLTNPTHVKAYGQLDVGVTYNATENLTIYFSGLNITEETVHVYGLTESQVLQAVQGGPRYDLGIRYTL